MELAPPPKNQQKLDIPTAFGGASDSKVSVSTAYAGRVSGPLDLRRTSLSNVLSDSLDRLGDRVIPPKENENDVSGIIMLYSNKMPDTSNLSRGLCHCGEWRRV